MISKRKAQALFAELATLARRGDELVLEIVREQAWKPLGYERLIDAWAALVGDYFVGSKQARLEVAIQFAKDGFRNCEFERAQARGIGAGTVYNVQNLIWAGVTEEQLRAVEAERSGTTNNLYDAQFKEAMESPDPKARENFFRFDIQDNPNRWGNPDNYERYKAEKPKYKRRGGRVSYPERQYKVTVEFTQAEVERFRRIAEARGTTVTVVAKQAIERRFDYLESELQVSV